MDALHQHHLLLVEDDPTQRELVRKALHQAGYRVSEANGLDAAVQLLDDDTLSLVVSDFKLADGDGLEVLVEVRRRRPELSFILVTAYGSIEHAVTAIQAGADDYLAKPFERQALLLTIERALRTRDLREENRRLNDELETRGQLLDLTGRAPAMQKLYRQIEKLAPTEAQLDDLLFAWKVAKHVKSNAIVYVKDRATVGVGAGQMSRLDSANIAAIKAGRMAEALGLDESPAVGSAVASDAFFPFPDGLMEAAAAGAACVIQPGGSMRDDEVIAAADEAGLAMVFTGMRHFRH